MIHCTHHMIFTTQVYQLASIVSHIGGSNAGKCNFQMCPIKECLFQLFNNLVFSIGHYISDVYRPGDNLWNSYDDSTITEVRYILYSSLMDSSFQTGL